MKPRIHALLLLVISLGVSFLYLSPPRFGDDFTYWCYGFDIHERGLDAWTRSGFHQLRWPVWGLCWLMQGIFGIGLASYYFAPFLFLALGALVSFAVGWKIFQKSAYAWACGTAFLFHPLLDSNISRPMPDINEGVIGAGAVFAWWILMHAETRGRILRASVVCGACLFLAEENRLTGVFFAPLLGCLTLLFFRKQWSRLLLPYGVFAVLLGGQMAFYQVRFGDWLHFIHANAGAKGKVGTEVMMPWLAPFRFLDTLVKGSFLMPVYAMLGALGMWFGWRSHGRVGRVVVAWFWLLYLAYACAPQQIWPYRPMLRDAARFLSSLAIPYSVLVVLGVLGLIELLGKRVWFSRADIAGKISRHPVRTGIFASVVLAVCSGAPVGVRDFYSLDHIPALSAAMRALPPDAKVFTHRHMRMLAYLADAQAAEKVHWIAEDKWITDNDPELIADAANATDFWYIRKLALMKLSKGISNEENKLKKQPPLAPWFDTPERDWQLVNIFARGDTPDIVLYHRREATTPPALVLTSESPEFKGMIPPLPHEWKKGQTADVLNLESPLPATLRGKLIRVEMEAASDAREAFVVQVAFKVAGKFESPYMMKPYFYAEGGKEFVCLPVPADADACRIRMRFHKSAKQVRVTSFRIVAEGK